MDWDPHQVIELQYDDWYPDTRSIVNSMGARIPKVFPIFPTPWSFTFECGVDDNEIDPLVFKTIIDTAGRRVGIGAMRVQHRNFFGQFVVTSFEIMPLDADDDRLLRSTEPIAKAKKARRGRGRKKAA
jgi:hypothetical protein